MQRIQSESKDRKDEKENKTVVSPAIKRPTSTKIFDLEQLLIELKSGQMTELDLSGYKIYSCDEKERCKTTFTGGHEGSIRSLEVLEDGTVLSSSKDKTIKRWDVKTGHCLATFTGHEHTVYAIKELKDGTVVLRYSLLNKTIKRWDLKTGRCLATFTGHKGAITSLEVLEDGTVLSGSGDKTIKRWDVKTGRCLATFTGHKGAITSLEVLEDGTVLSGGSTWDGTWYQIIKRWDVKTGHCLATFTEYGRSVSSIKELKDGTVVSCSGDGTIKHWDLKTGRCLATFTAHKQGVSALEVLEDGTVLCGADDKTIKHWDLRPRSLQFKDTQNLLVAFEEKHRISYINFQGIPISSNEVIRLIAFLSPLLHLTHLDVRNTSLSESSFKTLRDSLKQCLPTFKIQHESMPYYQLDFTRCSQVLTKNPEDKEAAQYLLDISTAAHRAVLIQFHSILEQPETLTVEALQKMFANVCHVADFKFPYTLLNMGITAGILTSQQREALKATLLETLTWLAKSAIVGSKCAAAYKLTLESVLRKKLIIRAQFLELDREAEKTDTFTDKRFQDLRLQLISLQSQINDLQTTVKEVKQEVGTLRKDVHTLANDLNQLKNALKRKAEREFYFGIAKTALVFIGSGLVDLLQSHCDLSDFTELSSSIFNIEPTKMEEYLSKARELFEKNKDALLEKIGEAGAKRLGLDPDEFIESWSETALLLQQLPQSATTEETKSNTNKSTTSTSASTQSAVTSVERVTPDAAPDAKHTNSTNFLAVDSSTSAKSSVTVTGALFVATGKTTTSASSDSKLGVTVTSSSSASTDSATTHTASEHKANPSTLFAASTTSPQSTKISQDLLSKYKLSNDSQPELEKGLRNAAFRNNVDDLRIFLKHVKHINAKDENNQRSALHWAAAKNAVSCVEELLKHDVDPFLTDKEGRRPSTCTNSSEIQALLASAKSNYAIGCD